MPESPERRRRNAAPSDAMEEENFPTRSPTRDAVEREMQEPANVRGPANPIPKRAPPAKEADEGEADTENNLR